MTPSVGMRGPANLITPDVHRGLAQVFASSLSRWRVPPDVQVQLTGFTDVYAAFLDGHWMLPPDVQSVDMAINVLHLRKDLRILFPSTSTRDGWFNRRSAYLFEQSPLDLVKANGPAGFAMAARATHRAKRDSGQLPTVAQDSRSATSPPINGSPALHDGVEQ